MFAYKNGCFPVQGGATFGQNLRLYASLPIIILLVVSVAPTLLFRTFVLDESTRTTCVRRAQGVARTG